MTWRKVLGKAGSTVPLDGAVSDDLVRLGRLYTALGATGAAIINQKDAPALLQEICRIFVEHGGLAMAFAGLVDAHAELIMPCAFYDKGDHAWPQEPIPLAPRRVDSPGMFASAISNDQPTIHNDYRQNPVKLSWPEAGLKIGTKAAAAFPLHAFGRAVGALGFHAAEVGYFDKDILGLIQTIVDNVSFALEVFAQRQDYRDMQERHINYDALTGLVNRTLLVDRIHQALIGANRHGRMVAVVFLDLDHLKRINESLGHAVGDELLKIVAERLRACVRESDTVARLGGDAFVLVLPDQESEAGLARRLQSIAASLSCDPGTIDVLQNIMSAISAGIRLAEHELQVTCSIGVSLYPQDGQDAETLLKHADVAMCRARKLGRNNFQFYAASLDARIGEQFALQEQLRQAIEREEFVLHYQPQVSLRTGAMVGMEALIRWQHPERGLVSPAEFIGLAEETGLIMPIGAWVMRSACRQCKTWQQAGLGQIRIAVNLSARQFGQADLTQAIALILKETELDPHCLEVELTESLVMTDVDRSIAILRDLKALGVHLSIDDFGTGYSSLAYLKQFPIDVLKIDQSFVRDIASDSNDAAIAKAIISMAHDLGIRVIAEGVETESQCDFLLRHLCDEIQGYFFSKPLAADTIEKLLRREHRLPAHLLRFHKRRRTLLLVDDESSILSAMKRLLRMEHCEILTAGNGIEALALLEQGPVDVIVSDQRMPGMSGIEFLRKAKERHPDTIRIMLSGYTELKSVIDAVNEGAIYRFLIKPWSDEQLRSHIEEAFRLKELTDDNRRLNDEVKTANHALTTTNRQLTELLAQQSSSGIWIRKAPTLGEHIEQHETYSDRRR